MKIKTLEISGFQSSFHGLRNPLNSWDRSDSYSCMDCNDELMNCDCHECKYINADYVIGENDMKLAQSLIKAGTEHSKFLRQIQVWADVDMPRYFWSEFDTYHFNSKNSCSTMHKLLNKQTPITLDMFAICSEDIELLKIIIDRLNEIRLQYNGINNQKTKDYLLLRAKRLLPEGFLQLRTLNTNYAELRNIYHQRKHHRLKEEWVDIFCGWISTLPYAQELICIER